MIVQKKEGNETNGVDDHKLEQMKERQGRVRMREALGFDANPDANEAAPSSNKQLQGTADRERRSRTSNKDREDRIKKYEELIGEFSDK